MHNIDRAITKEEKKVDDENDITVKMCNERRLRQQQVEYVNRGLSISNLLLPWVFLFSDRTNMNPFFKYKIRITHNKT